MSHIFNGKEEQRMMPDLFTYTDFRVYLQYYYEEKKRNNVHFSFQYLTQRAGFTNRGFLFNIIYGKKYLSKPNTAKLSKALNHTKEEAEYFENIVAAAQTKKEEVREYYLQKAQQIHNVTEAATRLIRKDQEEFYAKWHHSAIRALVDQYSFNGDYASLGRKLSPSITAAQAKRSILLLERLGLITKEEDGNYRITDKRIKAGDEISQTVKDRFHRECIALALKKVNDHTPVTHILSSITLGISQKTYEKIRKETRIFKDKIKELAENDKQADRVYQYQLMFYPLTREDPAE
jgi:uncharacterized protein (TIGR02147 family)